MKFISEPECRSWLDATLHKRFKPSGKNYPYQISYALPADAGAKTALARFVSNSINFQSDGLFWITCWGIFPSAENMPLFDGYRKSLGENRGLHVAPGHIIGNQDIQELQCLVGLSLYFFWDANLFDGAGTIAVKMSHDEYIAIGAHENDRLKEFEDNLSCFKLREIKPGKNPI